MKLKFFDAHTHFETHGEAALEVASAMYLAGIGALAVSTNLPDYLLLEKLAAVNPWFVPAVGVHPWQADQPVDWTLLEQLFKTYPVIGEIGLDRKWTPPDLFKYQLEIFERQLAAACLYNKPVNVHTSGADREVISLIRELTPPGILIHWFDGPLNFLEEYLELGCFISVAYDLDQSEKKLDILKRIPIDRLLCETDGPEAIAWAGKREPKDSDFAPDSIIPVYRRAAAALQISPDEQDNFFQQITQNALTCFQLATDGRPLFTLD